MPTTSLSKTDFEHELNAGREFYGRRWVTRMLALQEAEELRQNLERDGWQVVER